MRPETIRDSRILFAALNWGMGHVARSIPLLKQLARQGNQLVIAGNMEQNSVFYLYLENADYLLIDDYPFQFSGKGNFGFDLFMSSKALRKRLREEQVQVDKIVDKYKVDVVISDHRYGFISNKVPSICLTHQLNLPSGGLKGL
jgi:spore coat polysaccharide biosynthesis predicted glycosyltransferase SpsG